MPVPKKSRKVIKTAVTKAEPLLDFDKPYPRVEMAYPEVERVDKGPNNNFDLSELYSSRARYTADEKLCAVTAYVMTGTVAGAVRLTGFKQQVISDWKNNSSWWPDAYASVKKMKQEEIDGAMTTIVHAASGQILDRIMNGDEVISSDGEKRRRLMSGKELGWVLGITYDKRALLRGDPTSRSEKVDTSKLMKDLKHNFEQMAKKAITDTVVRTVTEEG